MGGFGYGFLKQGGIKGIRVCVVKHGGIKVWFLKHGRIMVWVFEADLGMGFGSMGGPVSWF